MLNKSYELKRKNCLRSRRLTTVDIESSYSYSATVVDASFKYLLNCKSTQLSPFYSEEGGKKRIG